MLLVNKQIKIAEINFIAHFANISRNDWSIIRGISIVIDSAVSIFCRENRLAFRLVFHLLFYIFAYAIHRFPYLRASSCAHGKRCAERLKIINANYTRATGTLPVTALHGTKAAVCARVM